METKLSAYVTPVSNVVHRRTMFERDTQSPSETVDEALLRRLYGCADNGDFKDAREDRIRDRLTTHNCKPTAYCNGSLQRPTATAYCNSSLQRLTATAHCNGLLQRLTATAHCNGPLQRLTATAHCNGLLQQLTATAHCNTSRPLPPQPEATKRWRNSCACGEPKRHACCRRAQHKCHLHYLFRSHSHCTGALAAHLDNVNMDLQLFPFGEMWCNK